MKTLTLLRHAKSGWDDPALRDFDRPLNAKGRRAARTVGRHLRDSGATFDHAIASPAVRVAETLSEIADGYGRPIDAVADRRLYLASAATILDLVRASPDPAGSVLVVGHNPGLEELVLLLVPAGASALRADVEEKFPTGSVATIVFDCDDWHAVAPGAGRLARFTRPRDLDLTLGPDR